MDDPVSVFDVWGQFDHADANAKNQLKAIIASGHKLVYHRDTLTHVDRRLDLDVFGPSIDTLVLAEILARDVSSNPNRSIKAVLEIGSGSGMLSASVVRHNLALQDLYAIDIDARAVACTDRSIALASLAPGVAPSERHLIVGKYTPRLLGRKFDLVICNPPYIPKFNASRKSRPLSTDTSYINAVAGVELLSEVLQNLDSLLETNGRLLLMLSSLSMKAFKQFVGNAVKISYPLGEIGYRVPFDVEAVLSDPEWEDYLVKQHGLEKDGLNYHHNLIPVWLEKR